MPRQKMTDEDLKGMPLAVRKQVRREEKLEEEAEQAAAKAATKLDEQAKAVEPPAVQPEPEKQTEPTAPEAPATDAVPVPGFGEGVKVEPAQDMISKAEYDKLSAELNRLKAEVTGQPYKSLQGKYNKEVLAVREELSELRRRLDEKVAKAPDEPEKPKVPAHLRHLNDEERNALKDEPLPVEARQAIGVAEEKLESLLSEVRRVQSELQSLAGERKAEKTKTYADTVWGHVEKLIPGARAMNQSEEFLSFLELPDPESVTGASYEVRGKQAFQRGDIKGVAAVVRAYMEHAGLPVEQNNGSVPPIKPSNSRAAAPVKSQERPMIKESDVAAFYRAQTQSRGLRHSDGTPWTAAEVEARTKEIELAVAEGRVIPGR